MVKYTKWIHLQVRLPSFRVQTLLSPQSSIRSKTLWEVDRTMRRLKIVTMTKQKQSRNKLGKRPTIHRVKYLLKLQIWA